MEESRVCTKCHVEQPIDNFRLRGKPRKTRYWQCATCQNATNVAWAKKHPERAHEISAAYEKAHRRERTARLAARRAADPEKAREAEAQYRKENAVKLRLARLDPVRLKKQREATALWAKANPEKARERGRRYSKNHPEKMCAKVERRRALKASAPVNDLTAEQFLEICQVFSFRCAYCPPTCKACKAKTHRLTQDHVTAFANNGSNTVQNVVPACKSCNSRKHTKPAPVMVQPLLLTVAPSAKKKKAS